MRVLVTGGAGFVGSNLVEALLKQGDEVTVLDDFSACNPRNLQEVCNVESSVIERARKLNRNKVKLVVGSVCNLKLVESLSFNVDVIYHLATQCLVAGLKDPRLMHRVNDVGTFNVCLAAKNSLCKLVYIGTSEEYGNQNYDTSIIPIKESATPNPVSIYGLTKLLGEQYVKFFHNIYKVPAVILRPFNIYGPRHREDMYAGVITQFIRRIEQDKPPIIAGDGHQRRDFTYVKDAVDGIILLSSILSNGETVNLGSGKSYSLLEIADLVVQAWVGFPGAKAEVVYEAPRPHDVNNLRADISLAKSFGYQTKYSFEEGLKEYVAWYKQRHYLEE